MAFFQSEKRFNEKSVVNQTLLSFFQREMGIRVMKTSRRVLVVGGLPEPIGGVTSFIYRLADNNMVTKVADLYPSKSKVTPKNFKGQVFYYKGLLSFLFSLFFLSKVLDGITDIHFNFSKTKSLVIFLIPFLKKSFRFHLTLHHGSLDRCYPSFLFRYIFSKIDVIYCLSESQHSFYRNYVLAGDQRLRISTSYVPMPAPPLDVRIKEIDDFIGNKKFSIISGYCTRIYNHDWVVRLFNEVELNQKLVIFLYGFIDEKYFELLKALSENNTRINIFFNVPQGSFSFYLSKASFYLRPNSSDSFGIAVADAVNYGVAVLASDVCKRYSGAYLFKPLNYECLVDAYSQLKNNPTNLSVQGGNSLVFFYQY
jgi:hypothetical protein